MVNSDKVRTGFNWGALEAGNPCGRCSIIDHRWVDGFAEPAHTKLAHGVRFRGRSGSKYRPRRKDWTCVIFAGHLGRPRIIVALVLLRSLGAGDWKLAGALGAFAGRELLVNLLVASIFVAGVMALGLVIYKGRFRQTVKNIGHILVSLVTFRLPSTRVSLDNPDALKVPYGVALALTVVLYGVAHVRGVV